MNFFNKDVNMRKLLLALLALPLLITTSTNVVFSKENALTIGSKIPSEVILKNQDGDLKDLQGLAGDNGSVIVFYRSAKWCPYCQAQLINLNAYHDDITEKGYEVVGVSYDSVEELKKFSDKRKIPFALLADEGSDVIKKFGIFNEDHEKGSFAYGVPHPTIYVTDGSGLIKAVLTEEGYKKRPEVSDIMKAIEK